MWIKKIWTIQWKTNTRNSYNSWPWEKHRYEMESTHSEHVQQSHSDSQVSQKKPSDQQKISKAFSTQSSNANHQWTCQHCLEPSHHWSNEQYWKGSMKSHLLHHQQIQCKHLINHGCMSSVVHHLNCNIKKDKLQVFFKLHCDTYKFLPAPNPSYEHTDVRHSAHTAHSLAYRLSIE